MTKIKNKKRKRLPVIEDDSSTSELEIECLDDDPIEEIAPPGLPSLRDKDQSQSFLDRNSPKLRSDLSVHKKKIQQVSDWFDLVRSQKKIPRILILTGPTGSAKSACVRVLCAENNVLLREWENGIDTNKFASSSRPHGENFDAYISMGDQFTDAIRSCALSQCLQFTNETKRLVKATECAHGTSRKTSPAPEGDSYTTPMNILLIEDLPNVSSLVTRHSVHAALKDYLSASSAVSQIIIIISDVSSNASSSSYKPEDSPVSKRSFLPSEILSSRLFCEIWYELFSGAPDSPNSLSFNPVAKTILVKTLRSIAAQESFKHRKLPTTADITDVAVNSNGDLRAAINCLQFFFLSKTSKGALNALPSDPGLQDQKYSIFSALGKLLYNKREQEERECEADRFLSEENRRPFPLSFDPELVFQSLGMSAIPFLLLLQQNYTMHESASLAELVAISEYLSAADLLGIWDPTNALDAYCASVGMRGALFAWDPTTRERKGSSFRAMTKSGWASAELKRRENERTWNDGLGVRSVNEYMDGQRGQYLAIAPNYGRTAVFEELLPYLGITNRFGKSHWVGMLPSERQYLAELSMYMARSGEPGMHFGEKDDVSTAVEARSTSSISRIMEPDRPHESEASKYLNKLRRMGVEELTVEGDDIED